MTIVIDTFDAFDIYWLQYINIKKGIFNYAYLTKCGLIVIFNYNLNVCG